MVGKVMPLPRLLSRLREQIDKLNAQHFGSSTSASHGRHTDSVALLRDLEDRVENEMFRLKFLDAESAALSSEITRAIDTQTNDVLYTLTVLSAIFVPANFLAAVYGMNFDNLPEVRWRAHGAPALHI